MTLTRKQIGLLHVVKAQLKLDDLTYRAILYKCAGVMSASDMDHRGFAAAMEYFTSLGFRSDWTRNTFGSRPGMATPRQVQMIRRLWREWAGADDEASLNAWLERSFGVSALRFVDRPTAAKAIDGLKAMGARKLQAVASAGKSIET